ncbi:MAG: hypothetical protein ACTSXA_11120 [Candidatus Heimdallarchaeota archaeon]
MTNTNKDKKSIVNLLDELINLSNEEMHYEKLVLLTNQLWRAGEHTIYSIIKLFVKKYRRTGILKPYKKSELQDCFELEQTQFNHYLQQAVRHNVLHNNKRKYSLNLENILVKRIWSFYFKTANFEGLSSTEMIDITSIMKKTHYFEKQIQSLIMYKDNNNQIQNSPDFTDFINEIRSIDCDPKDPLLDLCEKKLQNFV